ncbi:MAG: zinc ribbon domain-containing protein [Proteobacteria bacterium]|nr:zinc ribbon domain-containing protein [Pseudomonadota bacterium]MBU1739342.1 zinc ribbon domain-containing protein [Pseudomonadota bacterium]
MPLYDFSCRKCSKEFELLVMGGEKPQCPECGSHDLKKMMSSFSSRTGGNDGTGSGGKCSGCAGGSCSSCH